ncbi:hypothetical protein GIB67_009539 [Kingdonia uniflora]|uniref:RRM domain-containing protein n=1 Tax=Kingdonia uniflora TaxID=39325 RepID=A0A7J7NWX4_9MAGN|nr:hypothetical protein GIB67_009539 [Kingdonia uniflora]
MTNLSKVLRMASVMKAGDMLKQTVSKHTSSVPEKTKHLSSAPIPNMNILLRQIKSPAFKLFVGGLSYDVDDSKLKEAFSQYGEIVEAQVVMDAATSRSRGFGFVSFKSSEQANIAIQNLDGQWLLLFWRILMQSSPHWLKSPWKLVATWMGSPLIIFFFIAFRRKYLDWIELFTEAGIVWPPFRNVKELLTNWNTSNLVGLGRMLWRFLPFAVMWCIWLERNLRKFEGKEKFRASIMASIKAFIFWWSNAAKDLSGISLESLMVKWKETINEHLRFCGVIQICNSVLKISPLLRKFRYLHIEIRSVVGGPPESITPTLCGLCSGGRRRKFFYGRRLGVNFTSDLIGLRSGGAAASASSGGGGYRSGANGGGGRRF